MNQKSIIQFATGLAVICWMANCRIQHETRQTQQRIDRLDREIQRQEDANSRMIDAIPKIDREQIRRGPEYPAPAPEYDPAPDNRIAEALEEANHIARERRLDALVPPTQEPIQVEILPRYRYYNFDQGFYPPTK